MNRRIEDGLIAVIAADHMRAVIIATSLRAAGITTETFLSGGVKAQFKKAATAEALVIVRDDGVHIKDMLTDIQRPVAGDLVEAVRHVLFDGYHEGDGHGQA